MAAYVRVLTEEEWKVLESVLDDIGDGGILVPPDAAKEFTKATGFVIEGGEHLEYDFGGYTDYYIDVLRDSDSCVGEALKSYFADLDVEEEP